MNTLRDMPMITIEQKNRFREVALQIEEERDRLKVELENRSHEPEMAASDAYHYCADLIEPHVVDMPHGTECNEQSLCRSVCGSLAYLIAHWQEARGLRKERAELAAQVTAAQIIADADSVMNSVHMMRDGEPVEFESPGWRSKMGRDLHHALKSGGEYLARRDARMKAEALEALNPHDLSRFAKSIGEDAWDMNPVGICKLVNRMATLHREQAEGEA